MLKGKIIDVKDFLIHSVIRMQAFYLFHHLNKLMTKNKYCINRGHLENNNKDK